MQRDEIVTRLSLIIFLCIVLFCFITPIEDPDFFWHIASGRWILEHNSLPTQDPFSYTVPLEEYTSHSRAKTILTFYWLGNIIQYGAYKLAAYAGIIGLRLLVVLGTLLMVYARLPEKSAYGRYNLCYLMPLSYLLFIFRGDRPNQMTFFFLALFLYLIEALKKGKKIGYLLPVVYVIWANVHGGFILGLVVGLIYLVVSVTRTYFIHDSGFDKRLFVVILITLAAGFLNPNGYGAFGAIGEATDFYKSYVNEIKSPFEMMMRFNEYRYMLIIAIFILPPVLSILYRFFSNPSSFKERFANILEESLLVIFFGGLAFTGIRYIPLLAIAVTPVIAGVLPLARQPMLKRTWKIHLPDVAVIAIALWFAREVYPQTAFKKPLVSPFFPESVVGFMKEHGVSGRLFNHYDWGGYLIWRLYPEKAVFIDGRALSQKVFSAYYVVERGQLEDYGGKPVYKAILDANAIRNVLIPSVNSAGALAPLVPLLVDDPEWGLIYAENNCLLFTRDKPEQQSAKPLAYSMAITSALDHMRTNPDNPMPYLTVAKANVSLGRPGTAIETLSAALQRRPSLRGGPVEKMLDLIINQKKISHNLYELL